MEIIVVSKCANGASEFKCYARATVKISNTERFLEKELIYMLDDLSFNIKYQENFNFNKTDFFKLGSERPNSFT